jgi:hypothetical protein
VQSQYVKYGKKLSKPEKQRLEAFLTTKKAKGEIRHKLFVEVRSL